MTDDPDFGSTLGRRLDGLARARLRAFSARPAWVAPLAVTLSHSEQLADVLGSRFDRTEEAQPSGGLPPELAELLGDRPPAGPRAWDTGAAVPSAELREVPGDVRARLRREVGPAADLMRVHDGPEADARARAADADAVTIGRDVHVRRGRWAPRREEGVALLAHEATHVAAVVDRGSAWRRAVGGHEEEARAVGRERALLGGGSVARPLPVPRETGPSGAVPASPMNVVEVPPVLPGATLPAPVRRAGVERDLEPAPALPDLDDLRRGVITEVMSRMRAEIERGA